MFTLAMHDWYEPPVKIKRIAEKQNISLITPIIGQVVNMKNLPGFENWWEKLINKIR
jgi:hypothetical protein